MRWLAKLLLVWTPGFLKARACRDMSAGFTALAIESLSAAGPQALAAYREAARRAGVASGERMRADFAFKECFGDAELAWRLVCKLSGMKISLTRESGRTLFDHRSCPLFSTGGSEACGNFCIPFVEGLTAGLCPSCRVELVAEAGEAGACVKALVRGER